MTVVANVGNPTYAVLDRLWSEEIAEQDGHTLLAINPSWTTPADIGQLWERCDSRNNTQLCTVTGTGLMCMLDCMP